MGKKILISAYAISPTRGSEYGAAWNTVINLAREHELWVLYGMSDDHMGDTQTLRDHVKNKPVPNVTFIEVKARPAARAINLLNKAGLGWCFYFAYYLWQLKALEAAKQVLSAAEIDVLHQLGPIGFREPGFLGKLDKPLVWGPIGGMAIVDSRLLAVQPLKTRIKFKAKQLINYTQLNYSLRIRKAFHRADELIAATSAGQQLIKIKYNRQSHLLSEQGVNTSTILNQSKFDTVDHAVRFVWSGSHTDRKNLAMCLDVLSKLKGRNWTLSVLGYGPQTEELKQKAGNLNLSANIKWRGQLSRADALSVLNSSHLHIITSMAEDNPAVVFEALEAGVPTLTIDHCGMADVLCSHCSIKIPIGNYESMVKRMAAELDKLLANPGYLINLANGTIKCAEKHKWNKRLTFLNGIYDSAIAYHASYGYFENLRIK